MELRISKDAPRKNLLPMMITEGERSTAFNAHACLVEAHLDDPGGLPIKNKSCACIDDEDRRIYRCDKIWLLRKFYMSWREGLTSRGLGCG